MFPPFSHGNRMRSAPALLRPRDELLADLPARRRVDGRHGGPGLGGPEVATFGAKNHTFFAGKDMGKSWEISWERGH